MTTEAQKRANLKWRLKNPKYQTERYHRLHPNAKYLGEGITSEQRAILEHIRVRKLSIEDLESMAPVMSQEEMHKKLK
jgi:hypothetical protein